MRQGSRQRTGIERVKNCGVELNLSPYLLNCLYWSVIFIFLDANVSVKDRLQLLRLNLWFKATVLTIEMKNAMIWPLNINLICKKNHNSCLCSLQVVCIKSVSL